ncbi:MAG TPA: GNAT family N-acetyltransferase [Vicinamibacterales bacterium]|nr:GNAT family N-acetyltransferase [Vicinamibacterales bacterium]
MAELVPATGDYLEQILQDTYPLWNDGLAPERYARFWEAQLRTPWGSAHLDRVALIEGGIAICSAKRYDLSARIEGRIRRVLGIGAVFTPSARRGRGAAQRLLETMLETAEAEGFEYAMLFSEIDPSFYQRFDFVPVPILESRLEITRKGGSPAVLVRAGDDRDIPSVAEMSARRAEGARFALDRSEDWIRYGIAKRRLLAGLGPPGLRDVEFLVTEEGHQAVAYVVSTVHHGRWFIEDAGDRDPSGARLGAMLQAMMARTPHLSDPEIRAWLPHDFTPPQVTRVHTHAIPEVMMLRPLKDRSLPLPPLDGSQVAYCRLDYF